MFSKELPRIYELRFLTQTHKYLPEHFHDFDNSLSNSSSKMQDFSSLEKELQGLDSTSWDMLKSEIICKKKITWPQLMDKMNEVRGYNYLAKMGCKNIRFISPSPRRLKTPDIEAMLGAMKVLCEVKTIHISEKEKDFRKGGKVNTMTSYKLKCGFFKKLRKDQIIAENQLKEYDRTITTRRIVYVVINFDDWIGDGREEYFKQIQQFLSADPISGIEIVCCAKTALGNMHITFSNQ
jgi:hypothetical protein